VLQIDKCSCHVKFAKDFQKSRVLIKKFCKCDEKYQNANWNAFVDNKLLHKVNSGLSKNVKQSSKNCLALRFGTFLFHEFSVFCLILTEFS
jgi:hypothetical protein